MLRNRLSPSATFALASLLSAGTMAHAQQNPLPELAGAAKLVSFAGQVSVIKDNSLWALNPGDLVQPQQVIRTGIDGYAVFQVADGSKFEIFPNSKVVFRANRGDWKDLLEVFLGKVRVQIEHWGGLPNNNKVRTPSAVISVRGTIFDVEVEDEDATTLVVVEEGRVEVARAFRLDDAKILNAGEYLRIYRNSPIGMKLFDRGDAMRRVFVMARDAAVQIVQNGGKVAANAGTGAGSVPVTSAPGDKNSSPPPPTAPPPPASAAPPAPGAAPKP